MSAFRRVLIAVKNPDERRQPGVDKAIDIARQLGASVELFHALDLRRARLERLAQQACKLGVKATSHVAWDFPPHEAIVRRAEHLRADLIIADCHQGKRLKPWLMHLSDWELLRLSTRPVLLLKNDRRWDEPVLLAAVDPSHAHAKPARLDSAIVECAKALSRTLGGSFELMHANFPASFGSLMADPAMDTATLAAVYDNQKALSKKAFDKFAAKARIPKARCHIVDTDPVFAVPHEARELGADLVVMGAVSRSGLKRVFIGNTAERVLGSLPCDVLVIKPTRFGSRVSRRARGMRVVAPQPLMPMTL